MQSVSQLALACMHARTVRVPDVFRHVAGSLSLLCLSLLVLRAENKCDAGGANPSTIQTSPDGLSWHGGALSVASVALMRR